jgi:hypothetical protein
MYKLMGGEILCDKKRIFGYEFNVNKFNKAYFFLEKAIFRTVPQTDIGGWVEYTKAFKITVLKELGKFAL